GQIVVVTNEPDDQWSQIADRYVKSTDIVEDVQPWIAEVTQLSVSIVARPNATEPIRRNAKKGDLLRVTGASPGIEGDTSTWWATTEGYVSLNAVQPATSDWALNWSLPSADLAPQGWWGTLRSQANVRAAPTIRAPVVGTYTGGDRVKVLVEEDGDAVGGNTTWYRV